MKLILVVTTTVLFPLSMITTAWADPASMVHSGASSLDTQAVEISAPSENEADRLAGLATQINQEVGQGAERSEDGGMPSLDEFLNLPEDMVVRGTQRGGLAVGTKF